MDSNLPIEEVSKQALISLRELSEGDRARDALVQVQNRKNYFQRFFLGQYLDNRLSLSKVQFGSIENDTSPDSEELRILLYTLNRSARVRSINSKRIIFEAPELNSFPRPPEGFGYKGGAARLALRALLGEDVCRYIPRDLDLFRIGTNHLELDDQVARKYSPEDFKHGHSIELVKSIDHYLATRDIRLNEIIFFRDELICSPEAVLDMLRGELHPTTYLMSQFDDLLPGNIQLKMLRISAESELEGIPYRLCYELSQDQIKPFDIALHLDRVIPRGSRAINIFISKCIQAGLLNKSPRGQLSLEEAIDQLEERAQGVVSSFPGLAQYTKSKKKRSTRRRGPGKLKIS